MDFVAPDWGVVMIATSTQSESDSTAKQTELTLEQPSSIVCLDLAGLPDLPILDHDLADDQQSAESSLTSFDIPPNDSDKTDTTDYSDVTNERIDLGGCRRQTGQVETDAA